jgi:hypothetical protein
MWHILGTGTVHTEFWCGNLRERNQLGDPGEYGRITLKSNFNKQDGKWHGLNLSSSGF